MITLPKVALAAGLIFLAAAARTPAATFVVLNTSDAGAGSLRQAIIDANSDAAYDTITFNIPGAGLHTIAPKSALPQITNPVLINGYSQPGASANTKAVGNDAVLRIAIDASGNGGGEAFVVTSPADGSVIRGLVINGATKAAIHINASNTVVVGNFIGTNAAGDAFVGNTGSGVWIENGSSNIIGATSPQARNVIVTAGSLFSPPEGGIFLSGSTGRTGTVIQGNYIGLNAAGTAALNTSGSIPGIYIERASGTVIGGDDATDEFIDGFVAARNVISGNRYGIVVTSPRFGVVDVDNLRVQGNVIGLDATGLVAIKNLSDGIFAIKATSNDHFIIGGATAGAGNIISGNGGRGALLSALHITAQGNFIGTDASGTRAVGNSVKGLEINLSGSEAPVLFDVTIGGTGAAAGNVISGNGNNGLEIIGSFSGTVTVQGNLIGTQRDGKSPLPNGLNGIDTNRPAVIGGTSVDAGNVIAYNAGAGVILRGDNGDFTAPITNNLIFGNGGLAIDFGSGVVNDNDGLDFDTGVNGFQNYPVITHATISNGPSTRIVGTFNGAPNANFTIEFFSTSVLDASGTAQAEERIGTGVVTTNSDGIASFDFSFATPHDGRWVTATATDTNGNTSQVSPPADTVGPVLVNATVATARKGQRFHLQLATTGGTPLQILTATGLPPGLSADPVTGIISGTPTKTGHYDVALDVDNGATAGVLTIEVVSEPDIPVIISPSDAALAVDQPFTYKIDAPTGNAAVDPVRYGLQGALPPGLGFDAGSGTISGTFTGLRRSRGGQRARFGGGTALSGGVITNVQLFASNSSGTATLPFLFALAPTGVVNISTRLSIGTGENVLIGGFIITGNAPKKVIVRAIGPSLKTGDVPLAGAIQDPVLQLRDAGGALLGGNDNWRSSQEQEIIDTSVAPLDNRESALIAILQPGRYTAISGGKNGTTGIGLVEVFDLGTASFDTSSNARLANISTRGFVKTGDDVMIGGFIVSGAASNVIVRAIGPTLTAAGVADALQDTTLELRDGNGGLLNSNDDWRVGGQEQQIIDTTVPPGDDRESALVATLNHGNFTAVVRGKTDATGVALVEIYVLP
jgi:hypothetical protein